MTQERLGINAQSATGKCNKYNDKANGQANWRIKLNDNNSNKILLNMNTFRNAFFRSRRGSRGLLLSLLHEREQRQSMRKMNENE